MAYLQATSSNQKMITMSAVAAIHAIAIYAVVTGMAVNIIRDPTSILTSTNIKVEKKDPPKVEPKDETRKTETPQKLETQIPIPPIDKVWVQDPPIGPTGGEEKAGGGIDTVEFPKVVPEARPLFTARGPKARGSQGNWVRESDYPSKAIHEGHEGLTRVRLEINALGRVMRCTVTAGSGFEELDAAACAKLTDRARFDPATDSSGAKTDGVFSTSVRWQLPE